MAISETRLMLQLPTALRDQARAEAKRKHLPLNGLIRLALSEWLDEEQRTRKRR